MVFIIINFFFYLCGIFAIFKIKGTYTLIRTLKYNLQKRLRHRGPDKSRIIIIEAASNTYHSSDSEIVGMLYKEHGPSEFWHHMEGMHSSILLDMNNKTYYAGGDHIDIIQLYYALFLASELKRIHDQVNDVKQFPPGYLMIPIQYEQDVTLLRRQKVRQVFPKQNNSHEHYHRLLNQKLDQELKLIKISPSQQYTRNQKGFIIEGFGKRLRSDSAESYIFYNSIDQLLMYLQYETDKSIFLSINYNVYNQMKPKLNKSLYNQLLNQISQSSL